jgi:cytidylate kinase
MNNKFAITIGREFGSGGREIGFKVADLLGVKCYDKELISLAAKDSGICEQIFELHDEKPTQSFLYSLVMDTYSMGYNSASYLDMPISHKVFLAQFDTIKKIATTESCVFVGRCADYALEGNEGLISIFIHAPLEKRIERIKKNNNLDKDSAAKDLIIKTDKKRASYYNYYTNKKWSSSDSYHLAIDSSLLGVDKTAEIIVDFLNKKNEIN